MFDKGKYTNSSLIAMMILTDKSQEETLGKAYKPWILLWGMLANDTY
jgi:hypothetical protein